ncbi:MAG: glutathione S-transferase family protein [Proteobacteria bacterium]|nr:MAG: glutathione S-transferase family protein [Pseudomonadota bacterium]
MSQIILHHYDISPFSEKVRRVLAFKDIAWCAVEQPMMAPKPELTPLTGGYRRIPVMQIGADIYCDTALIIRRLEFLHPEPAVIPTHLAGAAAVFEDWADHRLFMQAVPPTVIGLLDALPPGFLEDRGAMTPGFTHDVLVDAAPHALDQTRHALDDLEMQLAASPFLLGEHFTVADAACFHPVRFMMNNPALTPEIEKRAALSAWVKRIEGFGPGNVEAMSATDALAIARAAEPMDTAGDSVSDADYALGDTVSIVADDYGQETTIGKVVRVLANEITVVREDGDIGTIAVHYPRAGYHITTA